MQITTTYIINPANDLNKFSLGQSIHVLKVGSEEEFPSTINISECYTMDSAKLNGRE